MKLDGIVEYLDGYLDTEGFLDFEGAENGLQVGGPDQIEQLYTAVDASEEVIGLCMKGGPGLLLVHHGLFWGEGRSITGPLLRKVSALIEGNIALYSAHLPLDAHIEVGNSMVLMKQLGLEPEGRFGEAMGQEIGWWCSTNVKRKELLQIVSGVVGGDARLVGGGSSNTERVGVVTGSAGSMIRQAAKNGIDTLITGEGSHPNYHDAIELGVNVIYAGHYATETWGVNALGDHLAERFALSTDFIDVPTGF